MKPNEFRSLSADELRARVAELRDEQFRLRFRSATETLESPLRLREVRRDIARVLTLLREQETGAATTAAPTQTATTTSAKTATKKTASKRAAKAASPKTAR